MRIILAAAVLFTAWALGPEPASAEGARWCAVYSQGRGAVYWDCQYNSIEACQPNVIAGNRGFCNLNPRFEGRPVVKMASKARKKRHARRH